MNSDDYAEKLKLLSGLAMLLQSCENESELFDVTYWYLPRLFEGTPGGIFLFSEPRKDCRPVFSWSAADNGLPGPDCATCPVLVRGISVDGDDEARSECRNCSCGTYCLPFREGKETFGVFCLGKNGMPLLESPDKGLALITTEYLSLAISNIRLKRRLREMSIRDPLTRLYNRRYMDDVTEREIKKANRSGAELGIILLDLDHFKRFNDTHGHPAGDDILVKVSESLVAGLRAEDMVARFGGEEFFILMPQGGYGDCMKRAEDLLEAIRSLPIAWQGRDIGPITASAGVAVFPDDGQALDDLLEAADHALYAAKSRGRDQVVGSPEIRRGSPDGGQ